MFRHIGETTTEQADNSFRDRVRVELHHGLIFENLSLAQIPAGPIQFVTYLLENLERNRTTINIICLNASCSHCTFVYLMCWRRMGPRLSM